MSEAWKIGIATIAASAILSIPSWLPLFGVSPEWFGNAAVEAFSSFLPIMTVAIGFAAGYVAKSKSARGHDGNDASDDDGENAALADNLTKEVERLKKELDKEISWGEIEQFSPRQLDLMARICDAEEECRRFLMDNGSNEMQDAQILERYGVIAIEDASQSLVNLSLDMDWRKFVKRRRAEIDEYAKGARELRESRERARVLSQNAARIRRDPSYLLSVLSSKGVLALDALVRDADELSDDEKEGCGELCEVKAAIYDEDPIAGISYGYRLLPDIANYFASKEGADELEWKLAEIQEYRRIDGE